MPALQKSPIFFLTIVTVSFTTKTTAAHATISLLEFSDALTFNSYTPPTFRQFQFYTALLPKGHIKTKEEAAMVLAQILYQTNGLIDKRELACVQSNCTNRYKNPNCDLPGQSYYGRGYIHLKGCENYKKASEELFGDHRLLHNPDLVATNETIAWATAFWYWGKIVHNNGGRSGHFGATTKAISPEECQGHLPSALIRFKIYAKVRSAFRLRGSGSSRGCYFSLPRIGRSV